MNARIAQLLRALRGGSSSANVGCSSEADTSATPYVLSHDSSEPSSTPTIAGDSVEVAINAEEIVVEVATEVTADAGPSKKRRRKHKKHRSKGSSKSSKHSQRSERQAAKDATEEKENTKHLKEMVVWWKQAREELKAPSSRTAEMECEKLIPDWAISARSSVLRSLVGQDSWELYKACLLERDQVLLDQTAHTRVEEHIAHVLTQKLTRRTETCLMLRLLEAENANLKAQLHHAKEAVEEATTSAFEHGRIDGEVAGCAREVAEGREVFIYSDEYKKMIATHRLAGVRDFLKTPTFKLVVDIQSARFLNEGFDKCVSQVDHLKGFVDGFDRARLNPSLDATLQPYPEEATSSTLVADEFEALASKVGCTLVL
ncbi:hypothetical protein Salat_2541400 [Sesamum alatum]|uniref:Uncharacterized protein n=1 Tax=Sesamum alatum TaxID=300844 RepID=A0AAE1XS96_9LAMI|nr:hypothetical protein Salat_2541400 [Sesamum alatum]